VGRVAFTNDTNAGGGVGTKDRRAKMLEEDVFESRGRGFDVRVQIKGVIGGKPTQSEFPEVKEGSTSPVGVPELSRGGKASRSSNDRTERNGGIRKRIRNDLRTG
jgi:hypothetical protein